jgi:hypothetical protein
MQKFILSLTVITLTILSFRATAQDAAIENIDLTSELIADPPVETEEEEEKESFSFSGFVDAYYQANFIDGKTSGEPIGFPTSFTPQANGFSIGMVNLLAEKAMGKVGFVGQVGFGPRAVGANSDSNSDFAGLNLASTVQQLFVTYSPSDVLTFTMGNFGTFVGYEVIDAPVNVNYSTSYLFSNGPFYHTGLKADVAISENFGAMVGIFNDTDSKFDLISGKHIGGQLSYEKGGLAVFLNAITGTEAEGEKPEDTDDDLKEFQLDLTATYTLSDALLFGLNTSNYSTSLDGTGMGGFFGTALYSTVGLTETFALSLRAEYFALTNAEGSEADEPNVMSFTASGNIKIGELMIIPEFRYDTGNNGFLFDTNLDDTSAASFILAAIYGF